MSFKFDASHDMHMMSSNDTAMNVMFILMGLMVIFDLGMLYAHMALHKRVKALEAELAARK